MRATDKIGASKTMIDITNRRIEDVKKRKIKKRKKERKKRSLAVLPYNDNKKVLYVNMK